MNQITLEQIQKAHEIAFPRHDLHEEAVVFAKEVEKLVHAEIMAVHDYPACALFRGGKCTCDAYDPPEAIAKKDAALQACVGAAKVYLKDRTVQARHNLEVAITQAQEALK